MAMAPSNRNSNTSVRNHNDNDDEDFGPSFMFGGGGCMCNTICRKDANGNYMCHEKRSIYAPIKGLHEYIASHQTEFVGRDPADVKTELKNQFPKLHAEILPKGGEPAQIKIVDSQRAVIRIGNDGKVYEVHGLH